MKSHGFLAATGVASALFIGGPAWSADVVENGSFEFPVVPNTISTPFGWTAFGGGVDIFPAAMSGGSASHGNQYVDLVGTGQGTFPSGIFQDLALVGGTTYRLSFDYNGQAGLPDGAVLNYSLAGLASGSFNVDDLNVYADLGPVTPWQSFETLVTPSVSATYRLTFSTNAGFFSSPFLDNVAVNDVAVAVPEPETYALMFAGLAAIGGIARRRKTAALR